VSSFVANEGRGYLPQSAAIPDMVAETQVIVGSQCYSALSRGQHGRANTARVKASFSVLQS
jgi:hypothetical protein